MPDELRPLWDRVSSRITGDTPHERFEVFMHYAEEHPDEAVASMQDAADVKLASLLRGLA